MALDAFEFFSMEVKTQQYLQEITNRFDYRCLTGAGVPLQEACEDFRSLWRTWILTQQVNDLQVVHYRLRIYDRPERLGAGTNTNPYRLKWWFKDDFILPGAAADIGGLSAATPLPTYVAVSARKVTGGQPFAISGDGGIANVGIDTAFRGGARFGGLSENQTKDGQGNELSTTLGSNFLAGWQTAASQFIDLNFREGIVGQTYTAQMMVRSDFGPGHVIRNDDQGAEVHFRGVTSIKVSRYVGSQVSRKQTERLQ